MDKELMLHNLEIKDGHLDMGLSGEPAKIFINSLVDFFYQNGGKNFLSMTVANKSDKFSIVVQNCNGIDSTAEKLKRLEMQVNAYTNLTIDLTRIIQRLEIEKIDLTVDDIKTVWKSKIALGYSTPVSVDEGTGSMIGKHEI